MSAPGSRILVVDDHRDMADGIAMVLGELPATVQVAYSAEDAQAQMEEADFDLVLSDVRMPGIDGMELLETIKERWPCAKVVMLTAHGTIDSAVEAIKLGACDYLTKPFDNQDLIAVARRAIAKGNGAGELDIPMVVGAVAAAVSADDLLPSLRQALAVLLDGTGADDGEIFLREPEGKDSLLSVWMGPDGEALAGRTRFESNEGYPGIVVATGKPLVTRGDLATDSRYLRRAVTEVGLRSYACVPLPDAHGSLGSLHLLSRRDDFPVERVVSLLEKAAVPISNAVRAGLAALRRSVDEACANIGENSSGQLLRSLLDTIRREAGCQHGTLALVDPSTGQPDRVVSSGPASLLCAHAEAGGWDKCPSTLAGHGFAADRGRRQWRTPCRRGLPRRVASPSCLPLVADGHFHGLVILDYGRAGADRAISRLVPLLTMAHQAAIRLQSHHAGIPIEEWRDAKVASIPPTTGADLELRCFGPFSVFRRGQHIAAEQFTRSKALVLLKMLALKAGAPLSRDLLIERLWPGVDPRSGANRLHGVVHALRSVIEPHRTERRWLYIRNHGELYYLDMDAGVDVDVLRYRLLVGRGLQAPLERRAKGIGHLEEAVELYRGDLFEDEPYADWCETERRELRELHLSALSHLAHLHTLEHDGEKAVDCLRRALRLDPLREDLHRALIELLVELARPGEAVADYDDYKRLLASELDADPSPELQALHGRVQRSLRRPGSAA